MTKLKKSLIIIGAFLLIISILSLVLSNDYSTTVSKEIAVPKVFVFNAVNNTQTYPEWYSEKLKDTAFHIEYGIINKGENSKITMSHAEQGNCIINIKSSSLNDSIKVEETWNGKESVLWKYYFNTKDSTEMTITITGESKLGFLSNLIPFVYKWKMKSKIKSQIELLSNITMKRSNENIYFGHTVKIVEMNKKFYLIKRSQVDFDKIQQYYTQTISALYQSALNNNISISGPPCGLFFKWDIVNSQSDMAAALPTFAELKYLDMETLNIDAKTAAMIEFIGDTHNTSSAHFALEDYLLDHSLLNDSPIVEEYITDPNKEADINKWVTNIIYYTSKK